MKERKLKPGVFISFDPYEERLLREMLRKVNEMQQELKKKKMTLNEMIRGCMRTTCHDALGQKVCLQLEQLHFQK